ncbi:hypothetical protein [Cellulomonas sp. Root137]|uniref:hypothetical protein n=1 Tax=Cellulomonas sp. Root137 TaxID=1736459 RepID=UPI0006F1F5FF|nr:hypothetical protein [Cellulomonas sp. Root137]KQY47353.1 hypothetical protein ASD18_08385 [Cellulomonas sp. Root137]KRD44493.1 hypothetical protein ASE38_10280 [Cellulomonas sp. Root930]
MWAEEVAVARPGTGIGAFLGWVLLGAGIGVGFGLGREVGRVGLFGALGLLLVVGVLVVRQGPRPAQLGIVTGLGALPLAIGWLNRFGPGEFCTGGVTGASDCIAQANPWPFVLVGVVVAVVGVALFARARRAPGRLVAPPRA